MTGWSWSKVTAAYRNMKIGRKLLVTYMLLILIPVLTIALITYHKTSNMMEQRVVESTNKSFEQANTFISYKLNNIKDTSSILFMNRTLQEILSKKGPHYPIGEQIDDYQKLIELIRSGQNNRDIYSIRMFVNSDGIYARENISILSLSDIVATSWYEEMLDNQQSIYCRPTYEYDYLDNRGVQQIISCVRPLVMDLVTGKPLGVLSVDVLEESISEIIEQTNITSSGQVYLLNQQGYVISARDKGEIGTLLPEFGSMLSADNQTAGKSAFRSSDTSSIVIHKEVKDTSWQLVAVIPEEEILGASRHLAQDLLIVLVIVIMLAVLTAIGVSSGITRRIRLLIHHMGNIEAEKWDYRLPVDSTDEIGLLQEHFNRMSANIKHLIQEKYQADLAKKNAELHALQAQINPHFLYNTLELIHWMAMKHRAADISDMVGMLAKFFRLSLSNGRDIITLNDELEHVRTYLDIQNRRFSGKLSYHFEIEPSIKELTTVKLILQPLVENAILHGIQEKVSKQGVIRIVGYREGDIIILEVEDDGIGMTMEQLDRLRNDSRTGSSGYGVWNIIEKIRLYYGNDYGLDFQSEQGMGTKVTIRIPAMALEG
jgi:two-component system sensor histidine kinase YesM